MTPIDFIIEHLDAILAAYQEAGTNKGAWENIKGVMPEIEQSMSFPTFKQYGGFLVGLNNKLNISHLLKSTVELNMVKHELDDVKQELNRLKPLNAELNKEHGLNMPVKHKLNIAGWSIQESGGYFRGFKKVAGKMQAVYLGKTLDGAEQKINQKEGQIIKAGNTIAREPISS